MPRPLKTYAITVTQPYPVDDPKMLEFTIGNEWSQQIDADTLRQMMDEAAGFAYVIQIIAQSLIEGGINPLDFAALKAYVESPARKYNF